MSVLTSFTVDELDRIVGGALDTALRFLAGTTDADERFETMWQAVGNNLRAGLARYLVVVDEVPPDLERIVRFLASRSNLDIGLVSISRFRDTDGHFVLVPQHLVRSSVPGARASNVTERKPSPELTSVVDAYNAVAEKGFGAVGRASNYRQIRPSAWPGGMHYEFLQYSDSIGVELHLESPACQPVAGVVETLARKAARNRADV
ncbi:hypothetical protein QHF83_50220 [Polyangium sp. 15x6]|nr:hypothetical protein [Polyangium sp. 15x6]